MVTESVSEKFNLCVTTIFKLVIKELHKRKNRKNNLLEQFNNIKPIKKREYSKKKIQELINISRELKIVLKTIPKLHEKSLTNARNG